MSLDLDRGVVKRTHPSGMHVCMYKDTPGIFYDAKGRLVKNELAQGAGYRVTELIRLREKQLRLAEYRGKLESEFEAEEQRLARAASEDLGGGIEVRAVGRDYAVFQGDERLTSVPLTLDEAKALAKSLAPESDDAGNETNDETAATEPAAGAQAAGRTGAQARRASAAAQAEDSSDELIG